MIEGNRPRISNHRAVAGAATTEKQTPARENRARRSVASAATPSFRRYRATPPPHIDAASSAASLAASRPAPRARAGPTLARPPRRLAASMARAASAPAVASATARVAAARLGTARARALAHARPRRAAGDLARASLAILPRRRRASVRCAAGASPPRVTSSPRPSAPRPVAGEQQQPSLARRARRSRPPPPPP